MGNVGEMILVNSAPASKTNKVEKPWILREQWLIGIERDEANCKP